MDKLTILADDLTGALDTGVSFASLGAAVSLSGAAPDTACRLFCLGTRHLSPGEARSRTAQALDGAPGAMYLKTDSLLRGHIGAGLEALAAARGAVFFAPAYPAMSRTTANGRIYIHGAPLLETVYTQDARNPVTKDDIAGIIADESEIPVCKIKPGDTIPADFAGVLLCDAQTDADLDRAGLPVGRRSFTALASGGALIAALPARAIAGKPVKGGVDLGVRQSFADIAATIYDYLTGTPWHAGESFLKDILQ